MISHYVTQLALIQCSEHRIPPPPFRSGDMSEADICSNIPRLIDAMVMQETPSKNK
jgi:hypothetical protein